MRRRTVYAKTERECAKKLRDAMRAASQGVVNSKVRDTVAGYMTSWLEGCKLSLRPQTWSTYERYIRLHINPNIGSARLSGLQAHHLRSLYGKLIDQGLSPTTARHCHGVIHKALAQAAREGLVARNVADLVDPPTRARREMTVLDAAQTRRLLDAAAGDRLEALYVLAVTTGMRRGELLALRWQDVDLQRGSLAVTGSLHRTPTGLEVGSPKTAKSRRRIELSALALASLSRHRASQEAVPLPGAFVFTNRAGRPVEPSNLLHRDFPAVLAKAGVPHIRFHDLRHTAATLLMSQGEHPKVVSDLLGHSNIGITLDLYSHVSEAMHRQAAKTMDDLLGGGQP
jgi:integrase